MLTNNDVSLSKAENENQLAIEYRNSQLCQNVLEELDHLNLSDDEENRSQDKAIGYATSFSYQVSQLCSSESELLNQI